MNKSKTERDAHGDSVPEVDTDVAIIGGGMVGIPLALGLAQQGFSVTLIEQNRLAEPPQHALSNSFDLRSTAISLGSVEILNAMGLWDERSLRACPIQQVHVSEQGRMGTTTINASELNHASLGYVVPNLAMAGLLYHALKKSKVNTLDRRTVSSLEIRPEHAYLTINSQDDLQSEHLRARLVIIADGAESATARSLGIEYKRKPYDQTAVIANLETELPNSGVAFERFAKQGPAALLPLDASLSALVLTLPNDLAQEVLITEDVGFGQLIEETFGGRLGRIVKVGERSSYPLTLTQASELCRERVCVVGNAAHSLHPVAGQGFNLALRGVALLLEGLALHKERPYWSFSILNDLMQKHRKEQFKIVQFSDQLVELFSGHSSLPAMMRSAGLVGLNSVASLKAEFAKHTMGRAQSFRLSGTD